MASKSDKGVFGTIVSWSLGFVALGFIFSWFSTGAYNASSFSEGVLTWIEGCLDFGSSLFGILLNRMPQG